MKTLLIAAVALTGLGMTAPAMAETYGSIGYSRADISPYSLDGVTGRIGWNQGVFGVEGEATIGLGDDTVGTTTVELKNNLGVYGVAKGAITPDFALLGRVGYARTEVQSGAVKAEEDGMSYGVGAEWSPGGGPNAVRLDYTTNNFNTLDSKTWSLGYVRRF